MVKSQITKDLTIGKVSIEESLRKLLLVVNDLDNQTLTSWIKNELNGYEINDELPGYRKDIVGNIKYTGFNGNVQVTKMPLPLQMLSKENREIFKMDIKASISELEILAFTENNISFDLTIFSQDVYDNSNGMISCASIYLELSSLRFQQILSNVKTKITEILLDLEKEFGVLDSLDIDVPKSMCVKTFNDKLNSMI